MINPIVTNMNWRKAPSNNCSSTQFNLPTTNGDVYTIKLLTVKPEVVKHPITLCRYVDNANLPKVRRRRSNLIRLIGLVQKEYEI